MDQGSKERPSPRSLSQAFMQVSWKLLIFKILEILRIFGLILLVRGLMAKLLCEIEQLCLHSLDRCLYPSIYIFTVKVKWCIV